MVALLVRRHAEEMQRIRVVRLNGEHLPVKAGCLIQPSHAMVFHAKPHQLL
jgi:hypothetical protein